MAKEVGGETVEEKQKREDKLKSAMHHLIANLREIAILIRPFMLETSNSILEQIGIIKDEKDSEKISWDDLENYKELKNIKVTKDPKPMFMRLNAEEEVEYIKSLMTK